MFERFSQSARQVVARARAEAARAGDDHIGCEHLLVSLLAVPGAAAQALSAAGLRLDEARAALAGRPSRTTIRWTPMRWPQSGSTSMPSAGPPTQHSARAP